MIQVTDFAILEYVCVHMALCGETESDPAKVTNITISELKWNK